MARQLNTVMGLCIVFFLLSCASQGMVENKPQAKFQGMLLARDIDDSGAVGVPREPTSEFNTEDKQAVSFLALENVSGRHNLRWEWIAPTGKVYLSTKKYQLNVDTGKYLPKVTAWHRISLKDDPAADLPGQWLVKAYIDDELIDSKSFYVKQYIDPLALPDNFRRAANPKAWALIIGIENYQRLPKVEFARKDALVVRDYFIRVLGVPEENIISLIDADATKGRMEGYLKKYLPANLGKDATLYVYFAGHGMPGVKKGEPYLVPYDADTRFIEQSGYKLISFYQDIYKMKLKHVYVFLDSCFSGMASRAAEMLIRGARPALMHVKKVRPSSDRIISLNATSSDEVSLAFDKMKHGLFTYYLLIGLRGEADRNHNGWISIKELYSYVRANVRRVSRRMQSEQTPIIVPSSNEVKDIALSRRVN
jgi:Caspase domain